MSDPYAVLGLVQGASTDEIKAAYRKLARQCHPDKVGGSENATKKFLEINKAYESLRSAENIQFITAKLQSEKMAHATVVDISEFEPFEEDDSLVFAHMCRCGDAIMVPAEDLNDYTVFDCEGCSLKIRVKLPSSTF